MSDHSTVKPCWLNNLRLLEVCLPKLKSLIPLASNLLNFWPQICGFIPLWPILFQSYNNTKKPSCLLCGASRNITHYKIIILPTKVHWHWLYRFCSGLKMEVKPIVFLFELWKQGNKLVCLVQSQHFYCSKSPRQPWQDIDAPQSPHCHFCQCIFPPTRHAPPSALSHPSLQGKEFKPLVERGCLTPCQVHPTPWEQGVQMWREVIENVPNSNRDSVLFVHAGC